MKIVVPIKQVPYIDQLKFDHDTKRVIRDGVESEINPFDKRALTEAINLKEKIGAETIVVTMGPPQAESALREALAMGIDRVIHLLGREFAGSDTLATARALAACLRELGADLVLCGKFSTDAETAQVPPMLAEMLDIPQVTGVTKIEWDGNRFLATREMDNGFEVVSGELPAVMTAAERLAKPRRATPEDLERVKNFPIEIISVAELGDPRQFGLEGSPTWVESIQSIEPDRKQILRQVSDGLERVTLELVEDLVKDGLFGEWEAPTHSTILPGPIRDETARSFWVYVELIDNEIRPVTFEMIGRAVELADRSGGEVAALVVGADIQRHADLLAAYGADKVYLAENFSLTQYLTEPFTEIVSRAIKDRRPFAVLFPSTANGRDLAPRVAARLNLGLTGDVIGLDVDDKGRLVQLKPAFGGNIVAPILSKTVPAVATVRPGMLEKSQPDPERRTNVIELDAKAPAGRIKWISAEKSTDEGIHLDDAEIVIGVGMGIGGPENLPLVYRLCEVLESHVGATRRVVDAGWLPRQLQIGLTGRSISPHLYIALGVRGAFNHAVGIQRSGTVLAINNDPNADIFKQCDYGLVGDWVQVVNTLIPLLEARKGSA